MTDKRKQQIEALEQFFKKVQESHPFGLGDHEDYELVRSLLEDLKGKNERVTLRFPHEITPSEITTKEGSPVEYRGIEPLEPSKN